MHTPEMDKDTAQSKKLLNFSLSNKWYKILHNGATEFRQLEESNVAFLHKVVKSGAVIIILASYFGIIFLASQFC